MQRAKRWAALSITAGLWLGTVADTSGQPSRIEIGMDAGLEYIMPGDDGFGDSPSYTIIGIPAQWVRAGFFVSDVLSIEPTLGLARISGDDQSMTSLRMSVAGAYRFATRDGGTIPFVRGILGLDRQSAGSDGDSESDSQVRVGAGGGLEIPAGERLFFRLSGEFHHSFEGDFLASANRIAVLAGLTVIVK
jgi:hypothetical protein